jgi:hypothetical protein
MPISYVDVPVLFLEVPPGIRPEVKRKLVKRVSATG